MKEWICQEEPLIRSDGANVGVGFRQMVELVRCKDCIHMKVMPCDIHGHIPIYCTNLGIYSEGLEWFCADGEAK